MCADQEKENILDSLADQGRSRLAKYQNFFIGERGFFKFLQYELANWFAASVPGAAGYLLRKHLYRGLCQDVGDDVQFGQRVVLRHPSKIRIGAGTAIDDGCVLDARGAGVDGFVLGRRVLVARDSILQAKTGDLQLGDDCVVGPQCYIGSAGGIEIGRGVLISGQCYIGGGRYRTGTNQPRFFEQDAYSSGPVVIEDDVWLGAGARILDGARIGRGSVVGAGVVVQRDVPDNTILTLHQKTVRLPRGDSGES